MITTNQNNNNNDGFTINWTVYFKDHSNKPLMIGIIMKFWFSS